MSLGTSVYGGFAVMGAAARRLLADQKSTSIAHGHQASGEDQLAGEQDIFPLDALVDADDLNSLTGLQRFLV
ncbi:MAG: hypothetical protein WCC04_07655, partial [Terriglobales bacterium]